MIFLITLALTALFAAVIAPYDPAAIEPINQFAAPSFRHWLGTDDLGRDVLSRLIYAARISISVGLVSVGISATIGVVVGMIAGYSGGWIDTVIMRTVDVFLSIPTFFIILSVIAFLPPNILNIMVVIGLTSWMGVARLIRAEVLKIRELDYIALSQIIGCSNRRLLWRHILPNAVPPVLVAATLGVAAAILIESGLSFLGLGVQPPTPSWGNMLIAGKDTLEFAWWMSVFPGFAILCTVLSLNLIGEMLRERLDPKRRGAQ